MKPSIQSPPMLPQAHNRIACHRPMLARQSKVWAAFPAALLSVGLFGCTVGPDYSRPSAPEPVAYKELKGWKRATPRDDRDRSSWWSVFRDTKLDSFESRVEISNQAVAAAEAAYRQSLAIIKKDQAGLFPTATLNYGVTWSYAGASGGSFSTIPGTSVAVAPPVALGRRLSCRRTVVSLASMPKRRSSLSLTWPPAA